MLAHFILRSSQICACLISKLQAGTVPKEDSRWPGPRLKDFHTVTCMRYTSYLRVRFRLTWLARIVWKSGCRKWPQSHREWSWGCRNQSRATWLAWRFKHWAPSWHSPGKLSKAYVLRKREEPFGSTIRLLSLKWATWCGTYLFQLQSLLLYDRAYLLHSILCSKVFSWQSLGTHFHSWGKHK